MAKSSVFSGLLIALLVLSTAESLPNAVAGDHAVAGHDGGAASSPVNPYAAEVNAYFGRGVSPENNVVTAVYDAFGPHPENANLSPAFFEALGIAPPSEDGHYFDPSPEDNTEEFNKQMVRAMEKPWKRDENPMIARWIEENSEPVKRLTDAVYRPYWYSPMVPPAMVDGRRGTLVDVLLPAVQQLRSVARFLTCRSLLHAGENRHTEAMQDSLLIFQLGRRSSEGSCVIEYLVGCAIQSIASNNTLILLNHHRYSAKDLERFASDYDRLSPVPPMLAQVTIAEKAMIQEVIDLMADGEYDVAGIYLGNTNATAGPAEKLMLGLVDYGIVRQRTSEAFQEFAELMSEKNLRLRTSLMIAQRATMQNNAQVGVPSIIRNYVRERSVGGAFSGIVSDVIVSQTVLPIAQSQSAANRSFARGELFRTLFAIEAYEREHGEYPQSLSLLIPEFLSQPAIDPCSGSELQYRRTDDGFRIYSFGENCQDDEGRTFGDTPYGDDIVATISRSK